MLATSDLSRSINSKQRIYLSSLGKGKGHFHKLSSLKALAKGVIYASRISSFTWKQGVIVLFIRQIICCFCFLFEAFNFYLSLSLSYQSAVLGCFLNPFYLKENIEHVLYMR